MLRLRECVVSRLLSPSSTSPICSLRRLLSASASASAAPISPNPSTFAVEEYLVGTCGLTRPQALKASKKLSHLKSPANPDAVLAFLTGLGLSGADAAAVVTKDPQFLCAKVDKTLAPVVDGLTGLGLSRSEIGGLVSLVHHCFRCRTIVSKLHFYLPLFGSLDKLLRMLKRETHLLSSDLDKVVKPNAEFLRECGLGDCDIAKLCIRVPRVLVTNPERVSIAVRKAPFVLRQPKESLKRRSEFLFSVVGLEPMYIAHRSVILSLSLEGRIRPRYYVVKFLKQSGLPDRDWSFYSAVMVTEKVFMEKFICPHKEAAPHLAEDYATACKGEVPTSIIFR